MGGLFACGNWKPESPGIRILLGALLILLSAGLWACASAAQDEISRDQAIEIARHEVSFEPVSIEAKRVDENGVPAWQITFRGKPGPPPLVPTMIVTLDRHSGKVLSLARS